MRIITRAIAVVGPLLGLLLGAACVSNVPFDDKVGEPGTVVLAVTTERIAVGGHALYLVDPPGALTLADVMSDDYAAQFAPVEQRIPSFGFTTSAYWARLRLRNSTETIEDWRLELNYPTMDEVWLYQLRPDGSMQSVITGLAHPFDSREISVVTYTFDLYLPPGETIELYLRLQNDGSVSVPLSIMPVSVFARERGMADLIWGGNLGTLVIVSIFYLLLYFQLRENRILWLALFSGAMSLYFLSLSGYGAMIFWPDLPQLTRPLIVICLAFGLGFLILFIAAVTEARTKMPWAFNAMFALGLAGLATSFLLLFLSAGIVIAVQQWLVLIGVFIVSVATVQAARMGSEEARQLLIAVLIPFPIYVWTVLATQGSLAGIVGTNLFPALGMTVFMLMVGRVIGVRTKQLRVERQAAADALSAERSRYQAILNNQPDIVLRVRPDGILTYVNQAAAAFVGNIPTQMVGQRIFDFFATNAHEALRARLSAVSIKQPIVEDERDFISATGEVRRLRIVVHGIFDQEGRVIEFQNVAQDVTEQRRLEQELERYRATLEQQVLARTTELHREERIAGGLAVLSTALSSSLELETILGVILEQVNQIENCDGVVVLVLEGDELVATASIGVAREIGDVRYRIDDDSKIIVRAYNTGVPIIVNDTLNSDDWPHAPGAYSPLAALAMPLRGPSGMIGVLGVGSHRSGVFNEELVAQLSAYATHAAIAINNARLYTAAQEAAAREERERLARDLHDAVTQTLFSASILAEAVPLQVQRDTEAGIESLEKLRHLTRGALGEMRALLVELQPSMLLEAPLGNLLQYLADATRTRTRLEVFVTVHGEEPDLPAEVQVAFYRIAQESLNNIIKHAQATTAWIDLRDAPEGITLTVRDNGRGLRETATGGMGLGIMRERAEAIGATFTIDGKDGEGTTVRVVWSEEEV